MLFPLKKLVSAIKIGNKFKKNLFQKKIRSKILLLDEKITKIKF